MYGEHNHFKPPCNPSCELYGIPPAPMSKLDELDKEWDERFGEKVIEEGKRHVVIEGMIFEGGTVKKTSRTFADSKEVKAFARKYYELGKLEEREAMKKIVENKISSFKRRSITMLEEQIAVETLSDLLSTLNNQK